MKKLCSALIYIGIPILILGLLMWVSTGFAGEGTKVLKSKHFQYSVVLPEKAPDFLNWDTMLIGIEGYSNGKGLAITAGANEDQSVVVTILWIIEDQVPYPIAVAVWYENVDPNKTELYEDREFVQTGNRSGKLVRVPIDKATPIDVFRSNASRILIQGDKL